MKYTCIVLSSSMIGFADRSARPKVGRGGWLNSRNRTSWNIGLGRPASTELWGALDCGQKETAPVLFAERVRADASRPWKPTSPCRCQLNCLFPAYTFTSPCAVRHRRAEVFQQWQFKRSRIWRPIAVLTGHPCLEALTRPIVSLGVICDTSCPPASAFTPSGPSLTVPGLDDEEVTLAPLSYKYWSPFSPIPRQLF